MNRGRQHIASTTLLLFVLGSVVAPFSHYTYMVFSDAYHVGGHHQNSDHGSHHASHLDGAVLAGNATSRHISCDYWSLFATFAATEPISAQAIGISLMESELHELPVQVFQSNKPLTYHLRGPPHSIS